MMELITASLTSYAITFLIASSSIFEPLREKIKKLFPKLKIGSNRHFIECRMCVGFWVSLGVIIVFGNYTDMFAVYGGSYFLATQEK